jgi:hypothetical protein
MIMRDPTCTRPCPRRPVPRDIFAAGSRSRSLLALPGTAQAGGTRTFRVADFDDFDNGEAEGAAIEASGKVTAGLVPSRAEVPGASAFTCLADARTASRPTSAPPTRRRSSA